MITDLTKSMNLWPVAGYATVFNWTDCRRSGLVCGNVTVFSGAVDHDKATMVQLAQQLVKFS